ncbi:hypothetical protein G6F70_004568 [Rhizopus microsporus]|uniref:STAS domain-containing protein n=1 Tax=Rhizopus azygosporus TaxID=86630 RepID=A0A367JB70_RHIAZ|nr:hypothetical protein G6F70_004568 [Rhizopus microsporus]KAG1265429.1 hypothetical protein G6F68_003574 [Rhizopus microsporus]RCH87099.1 hypothetical protein CU097_005844 [Rhizopus azygosporus]
MTAPNDPIIIDYAKPTLKERTAIMFHQLPKATSNYLINLVPIAQWIHQYRLSWLVQDMIAGITVGMLIVPQGIAYAKIANLDPQYGLYTSFVGVSLYCFFGTSKDISVGPIMSLLVGQAVQQVTAIHPEITGPEVAVTLSLFAGVITLLISLTRLGILVELIPEPVIAGYMTGSAITISFGQWPKVFGIKQVDSRDADYMILYEFFKNIGTTKLDAAFGIVALIILYGIKFSSSRLSKRFPKLSKPIFLLNIMRSGLIVIFGTVISYLVNRQHRDNPLISIIKDVPAGFDAMAIPSLNVTVLKDASVTLPPIVLILILEHISIAKAFSRTNNYTIDPNQEIFAIGLSNLVGSFFGAYPSTGAFSRTAVMARSGVKTPIAGVFSGVIVVLALYALTPAFYYIPESILAAVVIHAVLDLMAGPKFFKSLWRSSMIEFIIFSITVIIACFVDIETAIYVSVGLYLLLLFLKSARPHVISISRVKLNDVHDRKAPLCFDVDSPLTNKSLTTLLNESPLQKEEEAQYIYIDDQDIHFKDRVEFLPEGILIIKPTQSILYLNANWVTERILDIVKLRTRPNNEIAATDSDERPWNEVTSKNTMGSDTSRPCLEVVLFDFSSVYRIDFTALHALISLKLAMEKYAGTDIEWHFCSIANPEVRQLLLQSNFGQLPPLQGESALTVSSSSMELDKEMSTCEQYKATHVRDSLIPVDKYPAFHWDIPSAVCSISKRRQCQKRLIIS